MTKRKLVFKLLSETKIPKKLIAEAPRSGPFDEYAEWILSAYDVQVTLADSAKFLKGYGAWEDSELQDIELNKARLIWLAIGYCQDESSQYFYMGE